jgi:hypothetical protein
MPYNLNRISYRTSGGHHQAVYPTRQSLNIDILALAGGASQIVRPTGGLVGALEEWLTLGFHVLSFAIVKDQLDGLLRVEGSLDNGATFQHIHAFPLSGAGVLDSGAGFEIACPIVRFVIVNGGAVASRISGWIELESF